MTKNILIIYFIINIFAGQLYAVEHLTAHGFEDHEHNDRPCELNIYYENYNFLDNINNVSSYSIKFNNLNNEIIIINKNLLLRYIKPLTRAPPNFS